MKFNIIVNKKDDLIVAVVPAFKINTAFLNAFYYGKEDLPFENTTTEYFSCVEVDFDLLSEFSEGSLFKFVDGVVEIL